MSSAPGDTGVDTGWRRFLPIAQWGPRYERHWLRGDLIAGLTVWALVVPEAMAYAALAGMPAETGLYIALIAPLLYAFFGTSRQLNVGPSSTVAVMSAAVVIPLAGDDPDRFIALSIMLALVVGALFVVAGFLRLGFLADFMSKPVLDGFIVGLALTIAAGQAHKLFGIEETGDNFFTDIGAILTNLDLTNGWTLAVGAASLLLLFGLERVAPKIPAALVVTALAIIAVSALDLTARGVEVIGEIPGGLPVPGLPEGLTLSDVGALIPRAIGIVIVGFAESIAAARSYARKHGYTVDADQELIGLGASNAGAGLFGGFVVDGSLSKTAAADQAGQRTQMSSVFLSVAVINTLLFLPGLFENLPEATLGAIVIHAVWHLINFRKVGRYRRVRRGEFIIGATALVGVLAFDILTGLGIAVVMSILLLLARSSRPNWAILGQRSDTDDDEAAFGDVAAHPEAAQVPGLLIFRFDAQLFFANSTVFKDTLLDAIDTADPKPSVVLLDCEGITDVDITAISMLADLVDELRQSGIELWVARMRHQVIDVVNRAEGISDATPGRRFPTIRAAVNEYRNDEQRRQPPRN